MLKIARIAEMKKKFTTFENEVMCNNADKNLKNSRALVQLFLHNRPIVGWE
jgi:hypothetical protein